MKNRVSYFVALMAVLSGAATTGHAFTLGDVRGGAVIGRSLDVSVPVLPGSGEEALASCLSAEVLFGDLLQLNSSVAVTPVNSGPVPMAMVRIRSGSVVDEPVVTVVLRSSCGSSVSRRYVLLSDFPAPELPKSDATHKLDALPLVPSSQLTLPQPGAANADLSASETAVNRSPTDVGSGRPVAAPVAVVVPKPVVKKRPSPPPVKRAPPPEPVAVKPVLKLDPPPALPVLAETPAPAVLPASAALPAPSEEALQQAARIEALQNDVKTLKDLAQKNETRLADMQVKLRQAEAERVPMSWFYLVVGLLLASLGYLTWVLRRQQKAIKNDDAWWQQVKDDPSETVAILPPVTPAPAAPESGLGKPTAARVTPVAPVAPHMPTEPDIDLDIDLDSLPPADEPLTVSGPLAMVPSDGFGMGHNINLENVSDIRQQAEFFVSLGQTERALNILRKQVMESTEPNPLVYLDLLAIYHAQGMKADFRELRAAFNRFFNGVVPDFAAFNLGGSDLLDYPEPLAVLVRFWPNIEAIAFLEACIFHNDAAPMQLSFDLAAFRDLLMLHAVAETVTSDSPWTMTHHAGLHSQNTGPAELAGLAMVMDLRGKAAAKAQEAEQESAQSDEVDFKPLSVAGPPSQGLDLEFPLDTPASSTSDQRTVQNRNPDASPFPDTL